MTADRAKTAHPMHSWQCWRIILIAGDFFGGEPKRFVATVCAGHSARSSAAAIGPGVSADDGPAPLALPPPPYLQTHAGDVIQPGRRSRRSILRRVRSGTVVPLPSQTPGSIFGPPLVAPGAGVPPGASVMPQPVSPLADIAPGGLVSPQFGLPAGPEAQSPARKM